MVYGSGLLMRMVAPVAAIAKVFDRRRDAVCRGQERRELDRSGACVLEPQLVGVNTCGPPPSSSVMVAVVQSSVVRRQIMPAPCP
jgi:hypothetical protein